MIKVLAVVSLTAFLSCYGVQSAELSYDDLSEQILNSGTVVFLDFLEKVRNATENIVKDDQFRKTRITVQRLVKNLILKNDFAKPMKNAESGSQDNSTISLQRFFSFMADAPVGATIREISDKFFFPYMNSYRQSFKNETMVEIWKEMESYYLPGAPPIYNKPMEFCSYLLGKAVVGSQLVNMIGAGVETVSDIGIINFNQLHEEVQVVMDQIRKKTFEISILERQKEKNDFLISLRTASGLIVFYWDKVLEHTGSPLFNAIYLDSMKQWAELIELRNTSEKYHVLLHPDTRNSLLNYMNSYRQSFKNETIVEIWKEMESYYLPGAPPIYSKPMEFFSYLLGKAVVGSQLVNMIGAGVETVSDIGKIDFNQLHEEVQMVMDQIRKKAFEISILERQKKKNDFLISLRTASGLIVFYRDKVLEHTESPSFHVKYLDSKKQWEGLVRNSENQWLAENFLKCVIRNVFINVWTVFLFMIHGFRGFDETEHQQSINELNCVRSVIINELLKSKAFTREQLEEAPKNFIRAIHQILEKLKQYTDLVDGFDGIIDPAALVFEMSLHRTNKMFHEVWDVLLE